MVHLGNITLSEFSVYFLAGNLKKECEEWLKKWEERKGKWKWYDFPKPLIKILEDDELYNEILTLLSNHDNHEKSFASYWDLGRLRRNFTNEEIEKMIPETVRHVKKDPDISDTKWYRLPRYDENKRQGFLGKIRDDDYTVMHFPLLFNFDEFAQTHLFLVGTTGSGKSITAFDIAEEALENNLPVVVLDPTGQWTGFLEPCNDRKLIKHHEEFGMGHAKGYKGVIYTPSSDIGKKFNMNLLAKPPTDDESKLQEYAIEVSQIIQGFCDLSKDERVNLRAGIFEKWKNDEDLDYKKVPDVVEKDMTKKRLEELIAVSFLFEGERSKINEIWKKGEISVISFTELRSEKIEMFTAYYILRELVNYFDSQPDSPNELKLLVVVEEAHKFTEKNVWQMLDQAAKTLRKKGVGLVFITQGITDLESIRANTKFRIYMRIAYDNDTERASKDIGEYKNLLKSLPAGTGIISFPDFRIPVITKFRPCYHRNTALTADEIREKQQED